MPCYKPLSAWRLPGPHGKNKIFFSKDELNFVDVRQGIELPCGQCIGCRLERSRRWAVRLLHEKELHERTCFLTLTYSNNKLPPDGSLQVKHFQDFMKRLRRGSSSPLRFFHCGEYGEKTGRPHYHVILFGEDFSADRYPVEKTPNGDQLYASPRLSETWGMGDELQQKIGDVTFESAAYVARYCLKKVTGKNAAQHYGDKKPEYVTMSRRPGIGAAWLDKFLTDTYPSDSVVMRGKEMLPPPFYDKILEKVDPDLFKRIKQERKQNAGDFYDNPDNHSRRLLDRKTVKEETAKNCLRRKTE